MHHDTHDVKTSARDEMIDVTDRVLATLRESGVQNGSLSVYVPHTTAGVTINENADPSVVHDMLAALDRAVPRETGFYRHAEGNSAAHLKSSMVGCSLRVPVIDGSMPLGTWQGIYFCEFDGPRRRRMLVTVEGTDA
jgi:secondary thiamine-phosphate synthase enzyme